MPKGRLYDGKTEPRDTLGRKACFFLSVCVLAISTVLVPLRG